MLTLCKHSHLFSAGALAKNNNTIDEVNIFIANFFKWSPACESGSAQGNDNLTWLLLYLSCLLDATQRKNPGTYLKGIADVFWVVNFYQD